MNCFKIYHLQLKKRVASAVFDILFNKIVDENGIVLFSEENIKHFLQKP